MNLKSKCSRWRRKNCKLRPFQEIQLRIYVFAIEELKAAARELRKEVSDAPPAEPGEFKRLLRKAEAKGLSELLDAEFARLTELYSMLPFKQRFAVRSRLCTLTSNAVLPTRNSDENSVEEKLRDYAQLLFVEDAGRVTILNPVLPLKEAVSLALQINIEFPFYAGRAEVVRIEIEDCRRAFYPADAHRTW